LKVGGGNATDTNVNFVEADYSELTGLTGNGSTKYLRTGLIPSADLTINSTHLAIYNRAGAAASGGLIGAEQTAANSLRLLAPFTDGVVYSDQYNQTVGAGRVSAAIGATPYGLMAGTRTAANAHSIYKNGTSLGASATTGGGLPGVEIYIFASNNGGVPLVPAIGPLATYSIGSGLSASDVTSYTSHMEAFQDALGRGVQ
jgi:hypothetical protein